MSGTLPRKSELRGSQRFRVDGIVPLVYERGMLTTVGIGRKNQARAAINLSEGGLLIRTHGRLKIGTPVHVRLEIEKFSDVIEADGIVRWCFQSATDAKDFYAGLQFLKLPSSIVNKIARLRSYFTSPEYMMKMASKRRADPLGINLD
jgi:Tfp pilus assembly protein PilZ